MNLSRWLRPGPILLIALTLRLGWAFLVPMHPVSDGYIYDAFAREIAAGRGYAFPAGNPTVYWPVGPSALYGAFYALLPVSPVVALNIVMGCAVVAGIYRLGCRHFGDRVGAIAALIAALWPVWIQFTTAPNSELPFILFMVLVLLARSEPRLPDWARTMLSTALIIAAAFMRPTILPLALLLPLLDHPIRQPARAARRFVLALGVMALLLTPWAMRNQALFGEPVLVSANFGANLWMGNNPASTGGYMTLPEIDTPNEVTRDAYFKTEALNFIRANPGHYLWLCMKRIGLSFDRETIGVTWNQHSLSEGMQGPIKIVSSAYWFLAFGLSLIGVGLFLRENPARIFDPLVVAPALFAAVAVLVVGQDRYHMPMMPFIAIFAAFAIERFQRRNSPASEAGEGAPRQAPIQPDAVSSPGSSRLASP